MAQYVDAFITPVPKKNVTLYKSAAKKMAKILKEFGALEYVEYAADDLKWGKTTSFPRSVKLKPSEVVYFAYVTYKSKAQRNSIMKKVMKDARMHDPAMMPFDGKRMIYGSFKKFVQM
jgi:uncharacterized protein YbaA (DUF1428 family)